MSDTSDLLEKISKLKLEYGKTKNSSDSEQFREEGNKLLKSDVHDQKLHKQVLTLYSKSAAFALNGSEELALAFNNRSVVLFHLRKYKHAVIDIERALKITKSMPLKGKLLLRKVECLRNNNELRKHLGIFQELKEVLDFLDKNSEVQNRIVKVLGDKSSIIKNSTSHTKEIDYQRLELPKLTSPSKEIPCFSDAVELKYNAKYGRHIVANRDIKTGELICLGDNNLTYPLTAPEEIYLSCSHCLNFSWNSIPCDNCTFAVYCSNECKENAWKKYHDIECSFIPYFFNYNNFVPNMHIVMSIRLIILALKESGPENGIEYIIKEAEEVNKQDAKRKGFSEDGKMYCGKFRSYFALQTLVVKNSKTAADDEDLIASKVVRLFQMKTNLFTDLRRRKSKKELNEIILKFKAIFMLLAYKGMINFIRHECWICDCQSNEIHKSAKCNTLSGLFIAPCAGLVNHSCFPNTLRITVDAKVMLISCHPIKKNEQISINYGVNITDETSERQNYLLEKYDFTCNCQVCKENWPIETAYSLQSKMFKSKKSHKVIQDIHKFYFSPYYTWVPSKKILIDLQEAIEAIYNRNRHRLEAKNESIALMTYHENLARVFYTTGFSIPKLC